MIEIEHRFLALPSAIKPEYPHIEIEQRYISFEPQAVRVRIINSVEGYITVKLGIGTVRAEYEYAIDVEEAREIMDSPYMYTRKERKIRYSVPNTLWTLDAFQDDLYGYVIAEIEALDVPKDFPEDVIPAEVTNQFEANAEFMSKAKPAEVFAFLEKVVKYYGKAVGYGN